EAGKYGVGMVFFPRDKKVVEECRRILLRNIEELGLSLIGFRVVPADHSVPGPGASEVAPTIEQVFVKPQDESMARDAFERRLFVLRNHVYHAGANEVQGNSSEFYIASFSSKTVVDKVQLRTEELRRYMYDHQDSGVKTALALIHSRFSTS